MRALLFAASSADQVMPFDPVPLSPTHSIPRGAIEMPYIAVLSVMLSEGGRGY